MTRLLPLVLLGLTACGSPTLLPDGGRPRYGCEAQKVALAVKVVDAAGQGVSEADVTATNLGSGMTATYKTGGDGVTKEVTDAFGQGVVRLEARSGDRVSPVYDTTWTCDSCTCTVQPNSVVLTVH